MSVSKRLYRVLLRVYPSRFRARFEDEMVQLFGDQLRDARGARTPVAWLPVWHAALVGLGMTASSEHLRGDRANAYSATFAPTAWARALGASGVLAGIALLFVFAIPLEQELNPYRLIVFNAGVVAVAVGVSIRHAAVSPVLARLMAALVVSANVLYLAMTTLHLVDVNPFGANFGFIGFLAGVAMWLSGAAFGAATFAIGVFSRWAAALLFFGSLLAILGMDRLGLTGQGNETVFGPLSLIGIFLHGCGWIVLGAELALRRRVADAPQVQP